MPDIRDVYAETEALDLPALHTRREELIASAPEGDLQKLSDEALSEMLAINRALRKKVAANTGGSRRAAAPRAKKGPANLEDLA
jgi:hypothetical protein